MKVKLLSGVLWFALLVACGGGGGGDGDGGGTSTCSPAPSINSSPFSQVTIGQQYRYHIQFTMFCIPFITGCGVDLLQGPPGAGLDPIRVAVFWTPSAADVNTTVQFRIATKPDPCGGRASQSWNVSVLPTPPDTTPPAVSSTSPAAGTTSVPTNASITAGFSEDLTPSSVSSTSFLLAATATGVAVSGTVTYSNRLATLTPAGPLSASTTYTATITTGVTDTSGNALAAPIAWSFTSMPLPDTTPPAVLATSPPSATSCAPVDGLITATFNETIGQPGNNPVTLSDNSGVQIAGTFLPLIGNPPAQIAFDPANALALGSSYTATLNNTIRDTAGNALSGYNWSFVTAANGVGSWGPISMSGAPSSQQNHKTIWTGGEMIVWGHGGLSAVMQGGRYNPASDAWAAMTTAGAPSPRGDFVAVWAGQEMIVWGGYAAGTNSQFRNDGGRYDPAADAWRSVSVVGAPPGARLSTAVWTGTQMLVFGGAGGGNIHTYNGRYNPATDSWAPMSAVGAPNVQLFHTAIWTGTRMIVWGGSSGFSCSGFFSQCSGAGAAYDPVTNSWSAISSVGAPSPRRDHSAVWTGSRMIVWGGETTDGFVNTGGIYDPQTDTWQAIATSCAPSERAGHKAAWNGSEMFIWSGYRTTRSTLTGGRYDPASDSWRHMSFTNAPSLPDYDSILAIGGPLLIWRSGYWGSPAGFRYLP